jgi:predicted DNA-binding transcriptional regulator YafY
MTAHDLAQRLEVSERTIYRDLEALSIAGIPLYTERGPGGGCSLLDGYQTRLTGLTEMEVRALFLAMLAGLPVELGMEEAFENARLKICAALPESSRSIADSAQQRFLVDSTWWYSKPVDTSCLQTLREAVESDNMLLIVYREENGNQQSYLVEPYGLVTKAGVWYLIGMCEQRQHALRVSRIVCAEATTLSFTRLPDFDLIASWKAYCTQVEASSPLYASALRLAPDEVYALPCILSEWGYEQVRQNKTIPIHSRSRHPRMRGQQKKQIINPSTVIKKGGFSPQKKAKWPLKKNILYSYSVEKIA